MPGWAIVVTGLALAAALPAHARHLGVAWRALRAPAPALDVEPRPEGGAPVVWFLVGINTPWSNGDILSARLGITCEALYQRMGVISDEELDAQIEQACNGLAAGLKHAAREVRGHPDPGWEA